MSQPATKIRILVVDDDALLLDLLVDTLTSIGYDAVAAPGGVEALQILKDQRFDLMITDIKMPDVDGIQLLKKVRRYYSRMPVLFITGVVMPEIVGQAAPDGVLAKPFRISQIERLIEDALNKKSDKFAPKPPRILIVDEDEEFGASLSDALSYHHCLPFRVAHAKAAMQELENGTIDAVITNDTLTDTTSASLIDSIKKSYPDTFVVLTGDDLSAESMKKRSALPGIDAVLSKPFNTSEFLDLLDRHGIGGATSGN